MNSSPIKNQNTGNKSAIQDWYYQIQDVEYGPVSFEALFNLAKAERLIAEDQVKLGAEGKWRTVGSIGRLMVALPFGSDAKKIASESKSASVTISMMDPVRTTPAVEIPVRSTVGDSGRKTPKVAPRPAHDSSQPVKKKSSPSVAIPSTPAGSRAVTSPAALAAPVVAAVTENPNTDASILEQIRGELGARNLPNLSRIEVEVNGGVVTARGKLASEGERLLALRLLKQPGVVNVIDHLVMSDLRPSATPSLTPQTSPFTASAMARPVIATRKTPSVRSSERGPGLFASLKETLSGPYRNQAIAAVAVVGLLGFLFIPRGPARPLAVHPVEGKVILDGQPLANAAIVLHRVGDPKFPANLHPRGRASTDGTFKLETFDPADGAPDGEFVATVFLTEETEVDGEKQAGPNILPAQYSKPETSPLKLRITSSTKELQPLILSKG